MHVSESNRLFLGALKQALGFMPQDRVDMTLEFMAKNANVSTIQIAADLELLEASLKISYIMLLISCLRR